LQEGYYSDRTVATAMPSERVTFIQRTYGHLAGAILAFAGLETLLIMSGIGEQIVRQMFTGTGGLLVVMLLFIGGGYLAQYWARSATSRAMQYAGLGLYVVLEAVIFLPLLIIAAIYTDQSIIPKAALLTLGVFAGLTMAVFMTGKDFSFMRTGLIMAGWASVGLIVVAMIFPINLGTWFSFAMVGLAAAYIIYDTSNVMHHYRSDQHVAAALVLFASVALLFFYILRILLANSRRN
ncbi:MAG TPA: Bax inhibitor-1 family protein, partial [Gemmataceae bacterium]|nr:Bax inhibitor-1 family protein [Gemmataceae bacterium]